MKNFKLNDKIICRNLKSDKWILTNFKEYDNGSILDVNNNLYYYYIEYNDKNKILINTTFPISALQNILYIFRGKVKYNNISYWKYGYLSYDDNGNAYINDEIVDNNTIGQCTGIKDINENFIFDSDILQANNNELYEVWYSEDTCGFMLEQIKPEDPDVDYLGLHYDDVLNMKVITNRYDSPELEPHYGE